MNAPVFATLGCRLNTYETEAMKELSAAAGLESAVVVNTCAVTAEAVRKAKQEIRRLHREHPGARIIALTSTGQTVVEAAQILSARGYGRSEMHVLEHMGGPDERIEVMRADRIAADKPHYADFNTLGIQMRGFHDFGVSKQDFRGGVRMDGA